jgi:hypothetical protein
MGQDWKIITRGEESEIRGMRFDEIVFDDMLAGLSWEKSLEYLEWVRKTVLTKLVPGGKVRWA